MFKIKKLGEDKALVPSALKESCIKFVTLESKVFKGDGRK